MATPMDIDQGIEDNNNAIDDKHYDWYWKDNDGSFVPYKTIISNKINNIQINETYIMHHNDKEYKIHKISKDKCEQINTQTNYKRDVIAYNPSESTHFLWFWLHQNGSYTPYSSIISQKIDELKNGECHCVSAWNMKYEITKLTKHKSEQKNCHTKVIRRCIRKLVLNAAEDIVDNKEDPLQQHKYGREETLSLPVLRIGVIGAGQMATRILKGMMNRHILTKNTSIIISDPFKEQLNKIYNNLMSLLQWNMKCISVITTSDNKECIKDCDIVFVAVREQYLPPIMKELYSYWNGNTIIVDVSQIKFETLQTKISANPKQSILQITYHQRTDDTDPYSVVLTKGNNAKEYDVKLVTTILREMGVIKIVDESLEPIHNDSENGFIAKSNGERLESIARIVLMGVYDDDNVWSHLRGMRFIVKEILELSRDTVYWKQFISTKDRSFIRKSGRLTAFPRPKNININMMPFVMQKKFEHSFLPKYLKQYWVMIAKCIENDQSQIGKIGYLTVHESFVDKGRSQRRPGLHVETPGIIYINKSININKGSGRNIVNNMAWSGWGGGLPFSVASNEQRDGLYIASSVSDSCAIWDCSVVSRNTRQVIGYLGDVEHLRSVLPQQQIIRANYIYWLTDRTPHEVLPMKQKVYRQFFRFVTRNVNVWYKKHSTPNPNGIKPDTNITRIITQTKFETARKSDEKLKCEDQND